MGQQAPRREGAPNRILLATVAVAGMMFMFLSTNDAIFPTVALYYPSLREAATAVAVVVAAILVAISYRAPRLLNCRAWNIAALASCALYVLCCWWGAEQRSLILLAVGTFCDSIAETWFFVLVCTAFARLDREEQPVVACAACLISYALGFFLSGSEFSVMLTLNALCLGLIFATSWPLAKPTLQAIAASSPQKEMAVANPSSFLSFGHFIFLAILMFGFTEGTSLALAENPEGLPTPFLAVVTLLALLIVPMLTRRSLNPDFLFSLCAILALGGIFLIPAELGSASFGIATATSLLDASYACFNLLLLLVIGSVIARNPLAAVSTSALAVGLLWLGIALGAGLGNTALALLGENGPVITALSLALILAFGAFCFAVLKFCDFTAAINDIRTPQPLQPPRTAEPTTRERVAQVAKEFGLTKREEEVCELLASGRSASVICERLSISLNTTRYHAKNIYAKLGVHSQQELIDLVESELTTR